MTPRQKLSQAIKNYNRCVLNHKIKDRRFLYWDRQCDKQSIRVGNRLQVSFEQICRGIK
jgi:hypothetical protein